MFKKNSKKLHIFNHLKDKTFVYFNILTEDLIFSNFLGNFVLVINSLQKLGLIFQIGFVQINSLNSLGEILHTILNIFIPLHLSNETGLNFIFTFVYWFYLGYLIFQIIYIVIIFKIMKNYELFKFDSFYIPGLVYYKYINILYIYLFFLPQFSLYCFGIKCFLSRDEMYNNNITFNEIYLNKCEFFSWPIFAINLIQIVGSLFLQFNHSLMLFNTETQWKNSLAYSYSPYHTVYFVYEVFIVVLVFSGSYYSIFNIILMILQGLLIYFLLNHHVFHNPNIEKTKLMLISGEMILTLYLEICGFVENYSKSKEIFCFNVILILIYIKTLKISKKYYENYIENLLTLDVADISQDSLIDKKIKFYFFYIMTQEILLQNINYKYNDYPSFLIRGFQEFHREHCKFVDCLCKNKKQFIYDYSIRGEYIIDKEKPSNNLNNLIYIKHLLMNIYYVFSGNKRKKSIFLRINMAAFLFYQLKNFHKAVVECIDIKTNGHPHILHEILLFRLMRDVDKFQFNLDRNKWDIPEYSELDFSGLMKIEDNYLLLKNEIKVFISDYVNFLNELTQDHPNINSLEISSKLLYLKRLDIDNIFNRNARNPVSIRLYMEYLSNLIFSDDLKKPYEKEYLDKLELILTNQSNGKVFFELELMYNEDSIICQMGSSKGNLGHIIKANEGMAKFVGYSIAELEYANINVLMPERIAEKHDMYLMNFMETSRGNVIYRERKIFARNKTGYIQFSSILMKPLFDYIHDIFKFVAYMQPFSAGIEFAVVDEYGFIDSISKGLGTICNMIPDNYESKRLLIQSICPNLAEIFIEKQLTNELREDTKIQSLLQKIKGPKLDNGDYICKVYPFVDGVEDFRAILDKISSKIQKKEYSNLAELMEELIYYKEIIEDNIPNNCTFILQATLLILYSLDKTLEMNIFCFKEVDSIYLEIPQQFYGSTSNIFKNLEYFLLIKQSLAKKRSNKSLSKDELDRMGTVSFYNSNTFKSVVSQPDLNDVSKVIYDESDDISIHMNKKLDAIFKRKIKTKSNIDLKTEKLIKSTQKQLSKQLSKKMNSPMSSYTSNRTLTLDEDLGHFESLKNISRIEKTEENSKINDDIAEQKNQTEKQELNLIGIDPEIIERDENEENDENGDDEDEDEDGEQEENEDQIDNVNEEKDYEGDKEEADNGDEQDSKEIQSFKDLKKLPTLLSPTKKNCNLSQKNNSSLSLSISKKSKKFVSMFKKNMINSFHSTKTRTMLTKQNTKISLNEKNQLVKEEDAEKAESDHEINRMKEKNFEIVKKQNNALFHDGKGSSVGSSNATNVQARKTLRESIKYDYIPYSFKKIIWLFTISTVLIFISQAISTIYFQISIKDLSTSLKADQNYNEISFNMIRISNSFYKLLLMKENLMYSGLDITSKNYIFTDFTNLVEMDSNNLISNMKYLESNYDLFKSISNQIYFQDLEFLLINNTINLKIIKSIILFITDSLDLAKNDLNMINQNNNELYFILRNIHSYLDFFDSNSNFDAYNTNIISSIKQLMITIFGLTCAILFLMFVVRMYLYKKCFDYVNDLFLMLGSIPNEDLKTLQYYLKSMKVIFENTFVNLKLENDEKQENEENIDDINQNKIWKQKTNNNDSDQKNQRSVLQRRTKFYKNINFPLSKILIINFIWYMVFFLGYIGLLGLSNIFDNQLDDIIKTRSFIRENQYTKSAKAMIYALDYVSLKTNLISSSLLNISNSQYFDYINKELPQDFDLFSISSSGVEELYQVMQNTSICSSVLDNEGKSTRFFSDNYCNTLLNGILNFGIMSFLKNFYNCLAQINFENSTFESKDEVINYLNKIKFTDYSEGLEYIIWPLNNFKNIYQNSETAKFNDKLAQLNIFIVLELISISILVIVYWIAFLRPLKKRLIYCRKCFFHIPYAVLNQQVRILKYINSTGNLLLNKK